MRQTVNDLIKQFKLEINLPKNILNMEVKGEFKLVEFKTGSFPTYEDTSTYKNFEYIELRGNNCMCRLIPNNSKGIIGIYKIVGDVRHRAVGKLYDSEGNVVAIT